eukprot:1095450-Rhodomonas_salina.1
MHTCAHASIDTHAQKQIHTSGWPLRSLSFNISGKRKALRGRRTLTGTAHPSRLPSAPSALCGADVAVLLRPSGSSSRMCCEVLHTVLCCTMVLRPSGPDVP